MNRHAIRILIAAAIIAAVGIAAVYSQDLLHDEGFLMEALKMSRAEIEELQELLGQDQKQIRYAVADRRVLEAELERLLIEDDPDMTGVEAALRRILEKEVTIRLQEIKRRIAVRKLLGDERLEILERANREREEQRFREEGRGPEPLPFDPHLLEEIMDTLRMLRERTEQPRD